MPDNLHANETPPQLMNEKESEVLLHDAEELNGRLAMLGFIAALGSYACTGMIIPGIF